MTFKTTALTFIASETVRGQDAAGNDIADEKSFSFRGYEFPGGVVMIPRTSEADEFYLDRDAVRAHGEAVVTGVEVLDKTLEFDADELRSAVVASVREYGIESLPAPLADWLIPVNEAEMPDGSTLNVTAVQARRVWQVWRALAVAAFRDRRCPRAPEQRAHPGQGRAWLRGRSCRRGRLRAPGRTAGP